MRKIVCIAAIGMVLATGIAVAQPPSGGSFGPTIRPAFSPYLNLARQGVSPAVSYYGIVRPLQQQQNAIQSLQQTATFPNPFQAQSAVDQAVVTGNPYGFQNYRLYFQNQFSSGGFGGTAGGQSPIPRAAGAGSNIPNGQSGSNPGTSTTLREHPVLGQGNL